MLHLWRTLIIDMSNLCKHALYRIHHIFILYYVLCLISLASFTQFFVVNNVIMSLCIVNSDIHSTNHGNWNYYCQMIMIHSNVQKMEAMISHSLSVAVSWPFFQYFLTQLKKWSCILIVKTLTSTVILFLIGGILALSN